MDSDFGYDNSRFPQGTPDQFSCPICTQIAKNPKECPNCGSVFCAKCIDSWIVKKKECTNRCDLTKSPIRPIAGALKRIYNDLDITCVHCNKKLKMSDVDSHEAMCQQPKCLNFAMCNNIVKPELKDKNVCDISCLVIMKCKENSNNWGQALKEVQLILRDYTAASKPDFGGFQNPIIAPLGFPQPGLGNNGVTSFRWDKNHSGTGIDLKENNTIVFLKESAYMFRTIIGDQGFSGGIHYWEIHADDRTENELKIGISTKRDFNYNSAFCDYDYGFAYYGLGQLRHNSNAAGPQYGKRFKKEGVLGCFLDMNKGTLSFAINGEFQGLAFQNDNLKKGPIFAAVSLLHCAGCKLVNGMPAPAYFLK